ncbi:MAG: exonuclease SbcCD subunit D [Clostridia bacterium]|nr:exonuclease SbcCD subunit D [Oscillospiraceae bacterium]MBQ7004795.1 exonuclease SbcCD subunit D [Clostridia bacterium]
MKFIHLSDLHIGKRVNEFSMLEDQKYILKVIFGIIDVEKPDGIIIAGDVYDKSVPSAEAVQLLDDFLCRIAERKIPAFIISGNHDSAERLSFGGRLMDISGIHLSPVYNGQVQPLTLEDSHGKINIYMLPFIKPVSVRRFFPDKDIQNYTDAVRAATESMEIDENERNIIVTHQFVTGASRSDSEDISVGGSDNVDVCVFDKFDYVALGHIHAPQKMTRETVRYCGTPLKYSFSEAGHRKSVTVVELEEKGSIRIRTVPLVAKRDMREIKGKYEEIVLRENYADTNTDDYIHITLTNEEEIPDALSRLRVIYPNIMKLDYDNRRTRISTFIGAAENVEKKSPLELFSEFYHKQNNQPMSDEQSAFISELIEKIWEEEK